MSLYHYFESVLDENPELFITRAIHITSYDGLKIYFNTKVTYSLFRKTNLNLRNISICYFITI